MRVSSDCFESRLEGLSGLEDGPEYIDAPAGESDDSLMVSFSLASLAVVEGAAVVVAERAEGRLVEDALEAFVAADGPTEEAGLAGLAQDRRHATGRSQGVGGAEAREIACLDDELCGEHDPHAGQAADEGRIRVALKQRLQLAVEFDQARAAGERLGGQFADQARSHALGRARDGLLVRSGERAIGEGIDLGQSAGGFEMAHQPLFAGGTQFGRGNVAGQEVQRPLGGKVEAALQARENADEEVVQAREALGLGIDQIAPSSNQQPDLEGDLGGGFDRPQIGAGANLVGDCALRGGERERPGPSRGGFCG